jgi:Protein of unknown function (DUF3592)
LSSIESRHSDEGATTYHAKVLYEYVINGKTQSSHDIAFGSYGSSDPSHARTILDRYPKCAQVTVHYSPSIPAKAILEFGISIQIYFLPIFGIIFFCVGIIIFVFVPGALQYKISEPMTSSVTIK